MKNKDSTKIPAVYEPVLVKSVQQLFNPEVSRSTASRYIGIARDALGKQKHQILSITDFKLYYDLK